MWSRSRFLAVAALCVVTTALTGCPRSEPTARSAQTKGIVLVTVEGWWDPSTGIDPFPVEPLPGAVRFTDAMTPCPQVRPAVVSILTGATPDRTGIRDDVTRPLPPEVSYLPEMLTRTGWQTAAFVASPVVGHGSGLERGIPVFDAPRELMMGPSRLNPRLRSAGEVIENFATWSKGLDPKRPFFAWIHLALNAPTAPVEGAHAPSPSESWKRMAAILGDAGRPGDAAVVVVGVAGKLDASGANSGYFLTPAVLQVPMFYRPAKGRDVASWNVAAPRSSSDLAAVIADEAGIASPFPDAVSPAAPGQEQRVRFAWTWRGAREFEWPAQAAVVRGDVFLVSEGPSDPGTVGSWRSGESLPSTSAAGLAEALAARPAWVEDRNRRGPALPAEIAAALTKAKVSIPEGGKLPPTPALRERIEQVPLVLEARGAIQRGDVGSATAGFDRVAKSDAGNAGARVEAAQLFALTGRPAEARQRLEPALDVYPYHAEAWHWLSHAALLQKQFAQADAMLELSNFLAPHNADVLYDLACTRSLLGDPAGADTYLRLASAAGFRDTDHIERDTDLRNYRADPRYARFMQDFGR